MVTRFVSVDFTTKGATRVTGALRDIEHQATRTAAVTSSSFRSVDASSRKLAGAFTQARGGIAGVAAGLGSLGGGASITAVAGLTTVAAGLRSVINEAREQAKAQRLTEAVLLSTGGAAGLTADHVGDLASQLSRVTGIEDDVIQSGENVLLTFTAIRNEVGKGNDVFDQATEIALDMSAAFGDGDLQGNIIRVGKALQDPIGGLTALKKVGVNVTELQVKVRELVEAGDELGAQKAILRELQTEFGGAAAAAADPFSKLSTSIKDLKQTVGAELVPTAEVITDSLNKIASAGSGGKDGGDSSLLGSVFGGIEQTLGGPLGIISTVKGAERELKGIEALQARVRLAKEKLESDKASGAGAATLAADTDAVAAAELRLETASRRAAGGLNESNSAAASASFSYLGAAGTAKTLADALANIDAVQLRPLNLELNATRAQSTFTDALNAFQNPDQGAGGGGGQTAIAAALEQEQKQLSLRDAYRSVESAAEGVKDAEEALSQARQSAAETARAVTDAEENLRRVLHGVARDSKEAQDAIEALDDAQRSAAGARLDVKDAQRNLQRARNDAPLAAIAVREAELRLQEAREDGADPDEIARLEIQLKDARLAASAVNDQIRRAELDLAEARDSAQDSTKDLNKANTDLNHTLHGYPPNSKQAKDAQEQLTRAQRDNRQAVDAVTTAQQGLLTAQDATATSALNLKRAIADVNGQLESASGGGGGLKKLQKTALQTKLELLDLAAKGVEVADRVRDNVFSITNSLGGALAAEIETLKSIISAEPRLAATIGPILDAVRNELNAHLAQSAISETGARLPLKPVQTSLASGGPVPGSDPNGIPILAHPGEYVVSAKGVEKYGIHAMELLNQGKLPGFARGGLIGRGGFGGSVTYQINVQSLDPQTAQRLVVEALREETRQNGSITRVRIAG